MPERLQKLIAQAGIASRREAETYITAGRVTVNGQVAKLGDKADPETDDVQIDHQPLRIKSDHVYVMLNKPNGVVTTSVRQAQEHRRIVNDLIPIRRRLFAVGRLDADSEGLILLTDDGDLTQKLTHPRYEHPKTYEVTIRGELTDEQLAMWRRGVVLEDGPTLPADVQVIRQDGGYSTLKIVMREGRKRQIRRIAGMLGHPVVRLVRTQFGSLTLGDLRPGEWRMLNSQEIATLRQLSEKPAQRPRYRIGGVKATSRRSTNYSRRSASSTNAETSANRPSRSKPPSSGTRTSDKSKT